jgi:hypothetical protein
MLYYGCDCINDKLSNNVVHIMIINLSKPSRVSTARYLPITVSNSIKVAHDHTHIV